MAPWFTTASLAADFRRLWKIGHESNDREDLPSMAAAGSFKTL
jgi:hypothetical protein